MQDPYDAMQDPDELEFPEDVDPAEMTEPLEDDLVAEDGIDLGLDPDLAVMSFDEGQEITFE